MNLAQKVSRVMHDPLKTFRLFETLIAAVCILIPIGLKVADTDYPGFRPSISDYVYMDRSYVFGMLLTMAALLFIFNGAVYFRNENRFGLGQEGKWYNVILGMSLLAVILLPYKQHCISHYIFAGIFFAGNALVTAIFHKRKYRIISLVLAILTLASIGLHFFGHIISLLAAEWLSLTVIGVHFILEANWVIAFTQSRPIHSTNQLFQQS
jgi:hypothetical protein